jgi:hypothetical protein
MGRNTDSFPFFVICVPFRPWENGWPLVGLPVLAEGQGGDASLENDDLAAIRGQFLDAVLGDQDAVFVT